MRGGQGPHPPVAGQQRRLEGRVVGAVLHFAVAANDPYGTVERYKEALAPGSFVIITHSSPDYVSAPVRAAVGELYINLQVELVVSLAGVDEAEAAALAHAAHEEICPYSQATRGNIEVKVNVA